MSMESLRDVIWSESQGYMGTKVQGNRILVEESGPTLPSPCMLPANLAIARELGTHLQRVYKQRSLGNNIGALYSERTGILSKGHRNILWLSATWALHTILSPFEIVLVLKQDHLL
jgi:hypothetical protein